MSFFRSLIAVALLGMLGSAFAQVKVGNMTQLSASGTIGAGYSGGYTDVSNSSRHNVSVTGEGDVNGFYFNPGFLNFDVHPYYGRSQDSGDSVSIGTDSGLNATTNIFAGSPFPGTVMFSDTRNTTGQYAIPGSSSLVTLGNSTGYSVNWGENLLGLPNVSVGLSHSNSDSSVVGISGTSVSQFTSFNIHSNYTLRGWPLNLSYNHQNNSSETPATLTGTGSDQKGGGSIVQFSTSRPIHFWSSSFGASYSYSSFSFKAQDSDGGWEKEKNAANSVGMGLNFSPARQITSNLQFSYDENLLNSTILQVIDAGGIPTTSNNGPLRNLSYSGSTSWNAPLGVMVSGGAMRSQQFYEGTEFDSTTAYGTVNYNYAQPLLGSLYITAGMNDSASKEGNTGAGFFGTVTFSRKIEGFLVTATAGYSQNLQTLATFVTSSGMNYGAGASRKIWGRTNWHLNFSGGHSGFTQNGGQNHTERIYTGISRRRFSFSAFWGQANESVIQTTAGLVSTGLPTTLLGSSSLMYSSHDFGVSGTLSPIKRLSLAASYSKGRGESTSSDSLLRNDSTVEYLLLRYRLRKLYFTASYNRVLQGIISTGSPLHPATSYSFGIYRSLKFF